MRENGRVLVDTSVWVEFFRGTAAAVELIGAMANSHRIMISGQILQEVLQGSRDEKAFATLANGMALWDSEPEQPQDFVEAARIFARLRWEGITIPPSDCLIAAVAIRRKLPLCAMDADFDRIPHLTRYGK